MSRTRAALWISLASLGLAGILVPTVVAIKARDVPPLQSESDLENLMRSMVDGERMSLQMGLGTPKQAVPYERPELAQVPKDFVALVVSQLECPSYFATPQEAGSAWAWRIYGETNAPGDGRCERYLALGIAEDINGPPGLPSSIAADRIHRFLKKDQLLAYYLSGIVFARGVVGVPAASQALFHKSPEALGLAELAELSLALPVNGWYGDLAACRGPAEIQIARDQVLLALGRQKLVASERVETATHQPLACLRTR